jgi:hypothetical protein
LYGIFIEELYTGFRLIRRGSSFKSLIRDLGLRVLTKMMMMMVMMMMIIIINYYYYYYSPAWDTPKSRGKNGKNQGFLMRANFVSHSAIPQTSANASITGPASQNALLWAAPPS